MEGRFANVISWQWISSRKRELSDIQCIPPNIVEGNGTSSIEKLHLEAWGACLQWQSNARRLCAENDRVMQAQNEQISSLLESLDEAQRQIDHMQDSLSQEQADRSRLRAEYDDLSGDVARLCDEKQELYNLCEKEKLEKEVNQLIIDQYRDEIAEHLRTASQKDTIIRETTTLITGLKAEMDDLKTVCSYLQHCANSNERHSIHVQRQLEEERRLCLAIEQLQESLQASKCPAAETCVRPVAYHLTSQAPADTVSQRKRRGRRGGQRRRGVNGSGS